MLHLLLLLVLGHSVVKEVFCLIITNIYKLNFLQPVYIYEISLFKMLLHILLLLAFCATAYGYKVVSPLVYSSPCHLEYRSCGYSLCDNFPSYSCSVTPSCREGGFYSPQPGYPITIDGFVQNHCEGSSTFGWCCKSCPKGSKFYRESNSSAYCVRCDKNAVVYTHANLKGVTCVVAPSFVPKLGTFLDGLKALSVGASATACGKTTDAHCHSGHRNDDYRAGQAIDLIMTMGKKVLLRDACGDPNGLSLIEKNILIKAKNAGLIWGRSYSKTRCNHFEVTGPGQQLHETSQYKRKISVFQKGLKDVCTLQCGVKSAKTDACLCGEISVPDKACPPGYSICNFETEAKCIPTTTDTNNCGACDKVCPADSKCTAGMCTCKQGLTLCNNACVNMTIDADNCGGCFNSCKHVYPFNTKVCIDGVCTDATCNIGEIRCNKTCVFTNIDPNNCGKCSEVCPQPSPGTGYATCGVGKCNITCNSGYTQSGNKCECNHDDTCVGGNICVAGRCVCPKGLLFCGDALYGGTCSNLTTDSNNCGKCHLSCGGNANCIAGKCVCNQGSVPCRGVNGNPNVECISTSSNDEFNCGACGNSCPAPFFSTGTRVCNKGKCGVECYAGFTPENENYCGCSINKVCGVVGSECVANKCTCYPGLTLCDNACVNTATNPKYCGACNNYCPPPSPGTGQSICNAGLCYLKCSIGYTLKGNKCI